MDHPCWVQFGPTSLCIFLWQSLQVGNNMKKTFFRHCCTTFSVKGARTRLTTDFHMPLANVHVCFCHSKWRRSYRVRGLLCKITQSNTLYTIIAETDVTMHSPCVNDFWVVLPLTSYALELRAGSYPYFVSYIYFLYHHIFIILKSKDYLYTCYN